MFPPETALIVGDQVAGGISCTCSRQNFCCPTPPAPPTAAAPPPRAPAAETSQVSTRKFLATATRPDRQLGSPKFLMIFGAFHHILPLVIVCQCMQRGQYDRAAVVLAAAKGAPSICPNISIMGLWDPPGMSATSIHQHSTQHLSSQPPPSLI